MASLTVLHQALIEPVTFAAVQHGWRVEGLRVSRSKSCYLLLSRSGVLLTVRISCHAPTRTADMGPALNLQPHRLGWWARFLRILREGPRNTHPHTPAQRRAYFAGRSRGGLA